MGNIHWMGSWRTRLFVLYSKNQRCGCENQINKCEWFFGEGLFTVSSRKIILKWNFPKNTSFAVEKVYFLCYNAFAWRGNKCDSCTSPSPWDAFSVGFSIRCRKSETRHWGSFPEKAKCRRVKSKYFSGKTYRVVSADSECLSRKNALHGKK